MRTWKLVVALVLGAGVLRAQTPCLEVASSWNVDSLTNALCVADLDSDGLDDTLTGSLLQPSLIVRLSQSTGVPGAPQVVALSWPAETGSIAAGDIDGDQDLDLVVGHEYALTVLRQTAPGVYTRTEYGLWPTLIEDVALVDIDGDLDLDVVATDINIDRLLVFRNDGGGQFAAPSASDSASWAQQMLVADLDLDLDLDVVVVGQGDAFVDPPNVRIALNHGDGTFAVQPKVFFPGIVFAQLLDTNADGAPELVVAHRDTGLVQVHPNNAGSFGSPTQFQLPGGLLGAHAVDLDSDGDLELVTGMAGGLVVSWNVGGALVPVAPLGPSNARYIVDGDFNGDGARDLLVRSGAVAQGQVSILRGGCVGVQESFCFGDGSATPCPCGNNGGPGGGCATVSGLGAVLSASGSGSVGADDLGFVASGMQPGRLALLLCTPDAANGGAGTPFGDGLRCLSGPLRRLGTRITDLNGAASWGPGLAQFDAWNAGHTRRFQVGFRDTAGPCGSGFNFTQGLKVQFGL